MLGALLRLAVFRMLPRRILPVLVLYDVYRLFRRRAADRRSDPVPRVVSGGAGGQAGRIEGRGGRGRGRSSGGSW